jgi:hypothetical protein
LTEQTSAIPETHRTPYPYCKPDKPLARVTKDIARICISHAIQIDHLRTIEVTVSKALLITYQAKNGTLNDIQERYRLSRHIS